MEKNSLKINRILVCMDMSFMDKLLINYVSFLNSIFPNIENIIFHHNIRFDYPDESPDWLEELQKPLPELLKEKIQIRIDKKGKNITNFEIKIDQKENTVLAIDDLVKERGIDVVVLGKKISYEGSGYLIERLLGKKPNAHILVIPETGLHRLENILVPVDFNKRSASAVKTAIQFSKDLSASLRFLHVYTVPNIYFPYIPVKDLREKMKSKTEKEWLQFKKKWLEDESLEEINFSFDPELTLVQIIYNHALERQTDLIITPVHGGLGSNKNIQLLKIDMRIPILILNVA